MFGELIGLLPGLVDTFADLIAIATGVVVLKKCTDKTKAAKKKRKEAKVKKKNTAESVEQEQKDEDDENPQV